MKVDNRIVFMDGMFPAIFFPIGLPEKGGSCAYLTDHCLEYCPAHEVNKHEVRALNYFKESDALSIANRIIDEMCLECLTHLYWWPWGDCLPELTDKITEVMFELSKRGILQNGFTRNPALWKNIPFSNELRIGFHVDTLEEIEEMSTDKNVLCCPDITVNKAELYFNKEKVARCCGIWCDWLTKNETRMADCQECYLYGQGCFIGRSYG